MKGYTSETIRNVALLGNGGCGKSRGRKYSIRLRQNGN